MLFDYSGVTIVEEWWLLCGQRASVTSSSTAAVEVQEGAGTVGASQAHKMHSLWLSSSLMALLCVAAVSAASDTPTPGFATQYGGRQDGSSPNTPTYGLISGACGYGAIPQDSWPYWQVAALGFNNPVSYSGVPQKWGCGACIQVTCTGSGCATTAPFVVLVTDTCKDCAANQINMNALTYNKYISPTDGRKAVTWQQVPCSPPGNIIARVTAASGSYLRLVLMQVAGIGGVKSVEFRKSGSDSWIKMDPAWGANWQSSSSPGAPLDLRITPNDGSAPLVATGAISATALGDYDTGVQLGGGVPAAVTNATAATTNATAPYLGPPVGPQQIPAVAAANAIAAPANATAAPVIAPVAPVAAPVIAPVVAPVVAPVAGANATVVPAAAVPVTAPVQAATAPTNFTTLTFPGAAQSSQVAKPAAIVAVPAAAVALPTAAATAAVPAAVTPAAAASNASAAAVAGGMPASQQAPAPVQALTQTSKPVTASSVPMVVPVLATPPVTVPAPVQATPAAAPVQATPPATVPAPVQATPAAAPVQATPSVTVPAPVEAVPVAAQATPPVTVPAPVEATPPSPTAAVPSPAAAKSAPAASSPAAASSSAASPPQAAAIATGTGTAPAPVSQASGNPNQPFSLNFDRAAANVTGGSTAAAPSVNSAVEQILNPKVTYNSGGRRLA
ncbi:probable Expansin-B1 at N-terminal half [Coccomyxa sp. Obi]|nr:probable Expansin-B1 at N-terminal half [Coccomyxa sp. Obi]